MSAFTHLTGPTRRFLRAGRALGLASQRGVATTELALLSFLAGASVLAGTVLTGGELGAVEVEDAVRSGLETVGGTLFVRGSVVATTDDTKQNVDTIRLSLRATDKFRGVSVDPSSPDRMVVSFIDDSNHIADVPYDILWLTGDGDSMFEGDEGAVLVLRLDLLGAAAPDIRPDAEWELQVLPNAGGVLHVSRTMPHAFDKVMNLY